MVTLLLAAAALTVRLSLGLSRAVDAAMGLLSPVGALLLRTALLRIALLGVALLRVALLGVALLRVALLLRVVLLRLTVLAVAPTLIVPRDEAAHGLDHPIVVIGILPIGFGRDPVAGRGGLAGQGLVLVEHLMRVAAHPYVRPAAIENLIPIGWTVRVLGVVLLVMLVTAATAAIAAATRPLPIVWSH